jgi:RNA polymerase sigma factor (sigma-70 family)
MMRWIVDTKTIKPQRHSESSRCSFPAKTKPNRPTPSRGVWVTATRGDAWPCPERCDRYRGRVPLTDEQRALATRYLPMASALAKRMDALLPGENDELESTAYLALVEAAQTFDPSVSVNFATYARYRICGALRDLRRLIVSAGWRGDPAHYPVFQKLGNDVEKYGQVIGINPDRPVGTEIEATDAVEDWLSRLPRAHAAVCRLIYINGKAQDEAAAVLGCSKSYLSRLHHEAITWLLQDLRPARASQVPDHSDTPG